ncbi:MAG: response regulator transcription factor [Clostridia bacterium]|nr:response regulator transcription factor [Clostridia bacterium]
MIKLMIVDDQKIFREGLKMILSQYEEIEVVGLCENGDEATKLLTVYQPDVILMDIQMPVMNGVDAVKIIQEKFNVKVIMLTTFHDESYIYDAIVNGASGYLLKDTDVEVIYQAILTVHSGGALMDPSVTKIMMKQFQNIAKDQHGDVLDLNALSEREQEIAKCVAEGLNNKEISEKLFLGEGTIKNHLTKILMKLDLRDRTQLAIYVLKCK